MAQLENANALQYQEVSDSDESNSSTESTVTPGPKDEDLAEYDEEDEEEPNNDSKGQFQPLLDENVFIIDETKDTLLVGLTEKQRIFVSGVFCLQVVKGGILYGHTHYSASKDTYTVWHPLCDSIPSIQSSFYAGWEEGVHISSEHEELVECDLKDFPCIIKLHNPKVDNLLEASELYSEVGNLWRKQGDFTQNFTSPQCGFAILHESLNQFSPLHITGEWLNVIERLGLAHKNSSHDMRVIVLGGKNTGKSTLLRLLAQNFLYGGSSQEEILYFDLDPGQPEFSPPDCISINQLSRFTKVLGKHMGQPFFSPIRQHYLGSNSPQDIPHLYLRCIDELVDYLDEQTYMGTSLMNLPGWIKGFGLNILNHVIRRYKPTHIVMLESKSSRQYFEELDTGTLFTSSLRDDYRAQILKVHTNFNSFEDSKFSAATLRTQNMLAYFHTQTKTKSLIKYNFTPLIMQPPLQISFGNRGVQGIRFFEEFEDIHKDDIKNALQGTVVGLYSCDDDEDNALRENITFQGAFPILKNLPSKIVFFSLALIHSIDVENRLMNVYIPGFRTNQLGSNSERKWIMIRGKSETPFCELYPSKTLFNGDKIPYISNERRKKYEYIWKVRRNVMRRGHHLK
ncbi:hypothetical protein ZYGR_0AD00910 [Zygosaccharomyces rouxii]|uniref:Polynucleotide 5'-hydroxyl-kinase GRC3 n=2 Tax=Zygosaccharomyces rouxii TaxID=4956 RepID=C5DZX5_ZYGRC|nr:uncharacterized protein ZYRO0G07986g [Zygosaccharomyces rouxii]KAH9202405.1 hypothetical protein LQ764DRAFT_21102 [Zygosaccharomyces rouxii]GAV50908.1 hypothetical protein ZYGR_0AD00910 [Zygosaccharomyces rouxii]CAR29409.1 ZYRO0G07986p [Zygosaccharomyces rouxii]